MLSKPGPAVPRDGHFVWLHTLGDLRFEGSGGAGRRRRRRLPGPNGPSGPGRRRDQPRDRPTALHQSRAVRKHLERIYGKFEVRNRAEAAAIFTQERAAIFTQERVEKRQLRLDPGQPAATPLVDADSGVGASSGRRCASGCQRGDAEDVAAVLRQHGRDRITNTRPAIEEG